MSEFDSRKERIINELKKGPKTSGELLDSVKEGTNSMSKDTLYKNLRELELMEMIQSRLDDSTTPPRKYYALVDDKKKEKVKGSSRVPKPVPDLTKMDWLRVKIGEIVELDAQIQTTYASKPSIFNRRDNKLATLFENFSKEAFQIVKDLQGKYPEFDWRYQGGSFYDIAYNYYDDFREEYLAWAKYRGGLMKAWKSLDAITEGDLDEVVDKAHDFTAHISKFFVGREKYHV